MRVREPQRMFKIAIIGLDENIKMFHRRITEDGETIKLKRLYEIVAGFKKPTEAEQLMLAAKLQRPAWQIFNEEGGADEKRT